MGWGMGTIGNAFGTLGSSTGLGSLFGQKSTTGKALDTYNNKMDEAKTTLDPAFKQAGTQLQGGFDNAANTAKEGFQKASDVTTSGYNTANQQLKSGMGDAINTAKSGFKEAQGRYDTPEMVASRGELYNRVLGNGGLSKDVMANKEAGTREEYGTGMRGAEQSLSQMYGDSSASGLAGENMARAAADLGGKRANSIRDMEVGNAQLARTEQGNAITTLEGEAGARAGLSAQEAQTVSGLQEKLASGGANLTAQETGALSSLAAQKGITVAELQEKLATGQASLTTDEAKALVEMTSAQATGGLTVGSQKNLLQSLWG
jgi:hypothetical protein